jgi:transcriptional regulator with XRE-family HTH domain
VTVQDSVLTDTTGTLTAAVAHHVRALRQARGWSLDELAGRSGVSKGMVVQIEAARTNPSVGTLCRIADAFGVAITRLLEPAEERRVHVTPAAKAPVLWRGPAGGFGRLLGGVNEPHITELWEWRLDPGDQHTSPDHAPGTRELVHVRAGELTVTVDGRQHRLAEGDTIAFVADTPHSYRNPGAVPADVSMVVVMPPGEWDRRR